MSFGRRQTASAWRRGAPPGGPEPAPRKTGRAAGVVALAAGVLLLGAGGYLALVDTAFQATARVKLAVTGFSPARAGSAQGGASVPKGVETELKVPEPFALGECELIRSTAVLRLIGGGTNQTLPRAARAGAPETSVPGQALEEQVAARVSGHGQNIDISVLDSQPLPAALLANEVAEAYQAYRREHRWPHSQRRKALEAELAQADRDVARMREDLDRLRATSQIVDPQGTNGAPAVSPILASVRRGAQRKLELKAELIPQEALAAKLKGMGREEAAKLLPRVVDDRVLEELTRASVAAELKLGETEKTFGPEHVETQKAKAALAKLQKQTEEQGRRVVTALETRVEELRKAIQKQSEEIERLEAQDLAREGQTAPYWDLKRKLEEALKHRGLVAASLEATPGETDETPHLEVEIVSAAAPAGHQVPRHETWAYSFLAAGLVLGAFGVRGVTSTAEELAGGPSTAP